MAQSFLKGDPLEKILSPMTIYLDLYDRFHVHNFTFNAYAWIDSESYIPLYSNITMLFHGSQTRIDTLCYALPGTFVENKISFFIY